MSILFEITSQLKLYRMQKEQFSSSDSNSSTPIEDDIISNLSDTADLDDIELLQTCSRVDLFMLIKEDPKYYLDLIKKNKLEQLLNILVTRSTDGNGLNIKFKLYPNDRWVEVGYWGDSTDTEVYNEFKDQITIQLNKSQSGKKDADRYAHLTSQLDNNNNILSPEYSKDPTLKNISKIQFKSGHQEVSSLEDKLNSLSKQSSLSEVKIDCKSGCNAKVINKQKLPSIHKARLAPENLKECLEESIHDKPMEYLDNFVAQLLEKIIEEVPKLIVINKDRNYGKIIQNLTDINLLDKDFVPDNYKTMHQKLINQIRGCEYIQRIHYLTDWGQYPELNDYLVDFHKEAMQQNPTLYTKIKKDDLLKLLDDDDKILLDKYCLDIQEIWLNYLNHQD